MLAPTQFLDHPDQFPHDVYVPVFDVFVNEYPLGVVGVPVDLIVLESLYLYSVLDSLIMSSPSGTVVLQSDHSFPTSTAPVTIFDLGVPVVSSSITPTIETCTLDANPEYSTVILSVNSPVFGILTALVSDATIFPDFVIKETTNFPFVKLSGKFVRFTFTVYPVPSSFLFALLISVTIGKSEFSHTYVALTVNDFLTVLYSFVLHPAKIYPFLQGISVGSFADDIYSTF